MAAVYEDAFGTLCSSRAVEATPDTLSEDFARCCDLSVWDASSEDCTLLVLRMTVGVCHGSHDGDCKQNPTLLFDRANLWCLCGCPNTSTDDKVPDRWAEALNMTKHRPKGSASQRRRATQRRRAARRSRQAVTDWATKRPSGGSLKSGEGSAQRGSGLVPGSGRAPPGAASRAAALLKAQERPMGRSLCSADKHLWKSVPPSGDGEPTRYVCVVCAAENPW